MTSERAISFTIVTGLSGAGRSEASDALEDLGYFVIDNLPPSLIEKVAELLKGPNNKVKDVALVVDARGGQFFAEVEKALADLTARGLQYRILFLEASDEALVRRFEETRRRHPLATDEGVLDGIGEERQLMSTLREAADIIVDTTNLNVHELKHKVLSLFKSESSAAPMAAHVISFGYKHGLPLDADIVLDCRFLPNPHWEEELRPMTGRNRKVRGYVLAAEATEPFLKSVRDLLGPMMVGFAKEGRHYVTIALGCTGGRHRSVVIADEVARFLQDKEYPATVVHRDIEKE